jgi:hypothetical protein
MKRVFRDQVVSVVLVVATQACDNDKPPAHRVTCDPIFHVIQLRMFYYCCTLYRDWLL